MYFCYHGILLHEAFRVPFALPRSPSMSSSQVPQAAAVEKTARGGGESEWCVFFLRGLHMFFGYLLGWVGGGGLKPDMMNQHSESELIARPIHIFNILIYILTTNKPYLTHTMTLTHSKPNQKHLGGSTNHGSQVKFVFCSRHPNLAR